MLRSRRWSMTSRPNGSKRRHSYNRRARVFVHLGPELHAFIPARTTTLFHPVSIGHY
jgi:SAM-dependent methyltransferase